MVYTKKMEKAIKFATKTHEVYQKQKRKGKDVAYIIHPLTVGLILCRAGASEELVVAGILHDTVEDSARDRQVDREMLRERFGDDVADLVMDVTEKDKDLPWKERKEEIIKGVKYFPRRSLLLKSGDVVANMSELIQDHHKEGNGTFERFNASKEEALENKIRLISALLSRWPENPLRDDLEQIKEKLEAIKNE